MCGPCCSQASPVLDLYEVGDEAVGGTALEEVPLSCEEGLRAMAAELALEVLQKCALALFADLVKRDGIANRFYQPTLIGDDQYCVPGGREGGREEVPRSKMLFPNEPAIYSTSTYGLTQSGMLSCFQTTCTRERHNIHVQYMYCNSSYAFSSNSSSLS